MCCRSGFHRRLHGDLSLLVPLATSPPHAHRVVAVPGPVPPHKLGLHATAAGRCLLLGRGRIGVRPPRGQRAASRFIASTSLLADTRARSGSSHVSQGYDSSLAGLFCATFSLIIRHAAIYQCELQRSRNAFICSFLCTLCANTALSVSHVGVVFCFPYSSWLVFFSIPLHFHFTPLHSSLLHSHSTPTPLPPTPPLQLAQKASDMAHLDDDLRSSVVLAERFYAECPDVASKAER
jgi:hypothetical protein